MSNRILILSQVYPSPPKDGGRVDIFRRLHTLRSMGKETELIAYFNPHFPPNDRDLDLPCNHVHLIPWLRRKLSKLIHYKPYFMGCRENYHDLDQIVERIQQRGARFNYLLVESTHVLPAAIRLKQQLKIPKLILRMHNNEPVFFRNLAKSSPLFSVKKPFFYSEFIKYLIYERLLLSNTEKSNSIDHIAHISLDECAHYQQRYPRIPQSFLPPAIQISTMSPYHPCKTKQALFIGSLSAPNNIDGLYWYLKNVHNKVLTKIPSYRLCIAGNTQGTNSFQLKKHFLAYQNVEFIDSPESIVELYQQSCVFINPMRFGAGVKLKTVDAVVNGLPIVSTPCGNEGTGLEDEKHLLTASLSLDFSNHMVKLLQNEPLRRVLSTASQSFLKQEYNHEEKLKNVLHAFE